MSVVIRRSPFVVVLAVSCCAAFHGEAAITYGPPDTAADVAGELGVLEREVGEKNFAGAAKRLGTLLTANRGDALTDTAPATLGTVRAWLDGLSGDARGALAEALRAEHEEAARRALEGLRSEERRVGKEWRSRG